MRLGIFARVFVRPTLAEVLDAVKGHGLNEVQFNMVSAGLQSMPDHIPASVCDQIRSEMAGRDLRMASLSGTFNMAHPDPSQRELGLRRLGVLARSCRSLGTSLITLCTGTRDPHNQWRFHPDNSTAEAWRDMIGSMEAALLIADEHDVVLGVEPEVANVIDSAEKARRLLDEMGSPRLGIIMDAANVFPAGTLSRQHEILTRAFELLGDDIVMAHAKDISQDGQAGHEAAGTGLLDYDHYLSLLRGAGFRGALVLHSLEESQVDQAVKFIRQRIAATEP